MSVLTSYHKGLDALRADVTVHCVAAHLAMHLNCDAVLLKLECLFEEISTSSQKTAL